MTSILLASTLMRAQNEGAKPTADSATSPPSSSSQTSPTGSPSSSPAVPDSTKVELVKGQRANYPMAAMEKKLQGQVWLKLHISETGDVDGVDVVSGDPILAQAAVEAAEKWKFKPYIKNGHPVRVLFKIPMDFAFRGNVKDTPINADSKDSASGLTPTAPPAGPVSTAESGNNSTGTKQVRVSQQMTQGLLLHKVAPIYPESARQNHVQGTVVLSAIIDKDGRISELHPISGPKELTAAAIGAVQQWRYRPYMLLGEPVVVQTQITVNFQLR